MSSGTTGPRYQLRTPSRIDSRAWGLALGLLCGLGLLIATEILVLKGGAVVGPHLGLLGGYLPGYRVTFAGGLIGFAYGMVIGYWGGRLIGGVYNRMVRHDSPLAEDEKPVSTARRAHEKTAAAPAPVNRNNNGNMGIR